MLARVRDKFEELLASLNHMAKTVEGRLHDAQPTTVEGDTLLVLEGNLDDLQRVVSDLRIAIELETELESEGDISSCCARGRTLTTP